MPVFVREQAKIDNRPHDVLDNITPRFVTCSRYFEIVCYYFGIMLKLKGYIRFAYVSDYKLKAMEVYGVPYGSVPNYEFLDFRVLR